MSAMTYNSQMSQSLNHKATDALRNPNKQTNDQLLYTTCE